MLARNLVGPLRRGAGGVLPGAALERQTRCKMGMQLAGRGEDFVKVRGRASGVGRDHTGEVHTLGCVLSRDLEVTDFMKDYRRSMGTLYQKCVAKFSMSDLTRRRDDLSKEGFSHLYKIYKEAHATQDMRSLQDILSAPEFAEQKAALEKKKKHMDKGKRKSIEQIKFKPTAEVVVSSATVVKFQQIDLERTDYYQINVRFKGAMTVKTFDGESTEPLDEYCCFELAQSNDADTNVLAPLRIAGLYDTSGDRIGKDSIDPMHYKSMMETQAQS